MNAKQKACVVVSGLSGIAIGHWMVAYLTRSEAESVAAMMLILAAFLGFYWFWPGGN